MATLEQYQKQLEKFGSEGILEAAARDKDVDHFDLSHLKSLVEFQERNFIWTGDRWNPKHGAEASTQRDAAELRSMGYNPIRKCANPRCDLDIPKHLGPRAIYHSNACAQRAARRRRWERDPNSRNDNR